ncbi:MAG: dephospho-CoA kinase [Roseovarius sp.]|nr:dephospho-CoA kinase [Roseovarius sp.]
MTFKLGLTGSIGSGKSTTAEFFLREGCAVWDADETVQRLYSNGGMAVSQIRKIIPDVISNNSVSRKRLREAIEKDLNLLDLIEETVHPLVSEDRNRFLSNATSDIAVFDIPLLYETGSEEEMDAVACVTAPFNVRKSRVLSRGKMSENQVLNIMRRQMPDSEKCARANFVVIADTMDHARQQVHEIVKKIRRDGKNARNSS